MKNKEKNDHMCGRCGKKIKFWNINYYDEKTDYYLCNLCANKKENIDNEDKKKSDFE